MVDARDASALRARGGQSPGAVGRATRAVARKSRHNSVTTDGEARHNVPTTQVLVAKEEIWWALKDSNLRPTD